MGTDDVNLQMVEFLLFFVLTFCLFFLLLLKDRVEQSEQDFHSIESISTSFSLYAKDPISDAKKDPNPPTDLLVDFLKQLK